MLDILHIFEGKPAAYIINNGFGTLTSLKTMISIHAKMKM
jgi:hypothetical protein